MSKKILYVASSTEHKADNAIETIMMIYISDSSIFLFM